MKFGPDGTFKIVQFTDIHWHSGRPKDLETRALMEAVLDAETPDLVVLTGDVLGGHKVPDPAAAWLEAVAPMEARGVKWAAVFGNHDDESSLDRAALMELQTRECAHCLSEAGPGDVPGVGNYVLEVGAQDGQTDEPALGLYFLDSGAYARTSIGGYGWIRPEQIAWYRNEARARRRADGSKRPALAFFHIPIPEYAEVWRGGECQGNKHEDVCSPRINSGFFAALHEEGDVMATFVGHDHINDYDGDHWGIRLCYGRATGYNTYGKDGFPRGARIIECRRDENGTVDLGMWLRLADGTVEMR